MKGWELGDPSPQVFGGKTAPNSHLGDLEHRGRQQRQLSFWCLAEASLRPALTVSWRAWLPTDSSVYWALLKLCLLEQAQKWLNETFSSTHEKKHRSQNRYSKSVRPISLCCPSSQLPDDVNFSGSDCVCCTLQPLGTLQQSGHFFSCPLSD